jgi:hypothetical protein
MSLVKNGKPHLVQQITFANEGTFSDPDNLTYNQKYLAIITRQLRWESTPNYCFDLQF